MSRSEKIFSNLSLTASVLGLFKSISIRHDLAVKSTISNDIAINDRQVFDARSH